MSPAQEQALWQSREAIHEAMGLMACYAGMAQSMTEIGDDHGTAYSIRKALAYLRFALGAFNDLSALLRALEKTEAA